MSKTKALVGLATLLVVGLGYLLSEWYREYPSEVLATYVGRDRCVQCHQEQGELFANSHHDRAMDVANSETVLGKFDGTIVEHFGGTSRMYQDGERYLIETEGPTGDVQEFEVKYVFGVEPLQQYMVELNPPTAENGTSAEGAAPADEGSASAAVSSAPIGRVQVLRMSWDTAQQKWFYLSPPDVQEKLDPTDLLHWTGSTQCWNSNCATCHSTNFKKGFEPLGASYASTFSEIDVSCEACHGPGSVHVDLAENRRVFWDRKLGYGLNKMKGQLNVAQVETCAPCHSRRSPLNETWVAGESYDDAFQCQLIQTPVYHADGQIRDEDYVYGSFIQSKMFANNIRCSDCHDPHSLKLKHKGNSLCTSCHQHPAEKYDTPEHHFHTAGSTGASCVECHMPATTYMDVDARRDHSLRAPRPDLSVRLGTPNACTQCHLDTTKLPEPQREKIRQYLDWFTLSASGDEAVATELKRVDGLMNEAFQRWWGIRPSPNRNNYYEDLAELLVTPVDEVNEEQLTFIRDFGVPGMIRASGLAHLADSSSTISLELALQNAKSPDVKLVSAALMRLERALLEGPWEQEADSRVVQQMADLLVHPSPRIRIEAARTWIGVPRSVRQEMRVERLESNLEKAIDLWRSSLTANNDRVSSHMALGEIYAAQGMLPRAIDAFRTAIRVEPNLAGPRTNLSQLLEQEMEVVRQRMSGATGEPDGTGPSSTRQDLQVRQKEIERLRREENQLLAIDIKRAAGLPNLDFLHYRFAMSCYAIGDEQGLRKHLKIANEMDPKNQTYLIGLLAMHLRYNEREQAVDCAKRLAELYPQNEQYRVQLLELQKSQ